MLTLTFCTCMQDHVQPSSKQLLKSEYPGLTGVQLKAVSKSFGDVDVIPNIDLDINEGEFVVIVGPSGCGKSTTLRMIAGLEAATSGEVHIGGKDVTHLPPKQRDIAMVFQSYALYPHMDVAGNMSFSLRLANRPKAEITEKVQRAAEILGITELLKRKPKELSGGQRQRVAMGRAIVREAYCFLFDEPLSNLDAKLRSQMRTELAILHKRLNKTMIYVTHDQIEAMTMADRIVVMSNGHIQQVGTPREVYNYPDNLFVAGFIGSPSMNLLPGKIITENDNLYVQGDGFHFPIPDHLTDRVTNSAVIDTIVGLRPEHFRESANTSSRSTSSFSPVHLKVDVAEYIGSSQFLAASIGTKRVTAAIEVSADTEELGSGEYLFDTQRLYLFDPKSEKAI